MASPHVEVFDLLGNERMVSAHVEVFDILGTLILMKQETQEDIEHVRDLEKILIECLEENKIILHSEHLETIKHLNLVNLLESQMKIIDNRIEENEKLMEAMEACPAELCLACSMAKVSINKETNN